MRDKVKDMFWEIKMPESCEQAIRQAAEEKAPKAFPQKRWISNPAAMAAVLALVLFLSPAVRAAVEEWTVKYVFPELGLTIYENEEAGNLTIQAVCYDTETEPFAEVRDGRLYFTGNGQDLDITNETANAQPFVYTYTDDQGFTNYMVVGYSETVENFGIYEFIREQGDDLEPWEGWITGTGRNFLDPETDQAYPWVNAIWKDLNIPWPMPGDTAVDYDVTVTDNGTGEAEWIEIAKNE